MNWAIFSDGNSPFITFIASFLIWFMFAALFYFWVVNGKLNKNQAIRALLASIIAGLIAQAIKMLFPSSRPFEVNGKPPLTLTVPFDSSFPSWHSSTAFGLASGVWLNDKKTGNLFVISAVFVALGRMLGNVHYLSDIIAGSMLGAATGLVLEKSKLPRLLKKRKR
jgi:undecaprenyl-diphosphatase